MATTLKAQELGPSEKIDGQSMISSNQSSNEFDCAAHFERPANELALLMNAKQILESELLLDQRIFTGECIGNILGTDSTHASHPSDELPHFRGNTLTQSLAESLERRPPRYKREFYVIGQTKENDRVVGILRLTFSEERKLKFSVLRAIINGDWKIDPSPYSPHAPFIPTPTSVDGNRTYLLDKVIENSIAKICVSLDPHGNVKTFFAEQK